MIHIAVKHNIAKEYLDKDYPPNQRHFEKNNNEDAKQNDMKDIKIQNLEKSLKKAESKLENLTNRNKRQTIRIQELEECSRSSESDIKNQESNAQDLKLKEKIVAKIFMADSANENLQALLNLDDDKLLEKFEKIIRSKNM